MGKPAQSHTTSHREIIDQWWWDNLGNRDVSHARARAARLKRGDQLSILADPEVHKLAGSLHVGFDRADALVRVVQALANVRASGPSLPRALGGTDPVLSHTRFERLIRCTLEDIGTAIRRALPMVNHKCDPGRLGADLLWWNEQTRIRWTFDYYHVSPPQSDTGDMVSTAGKGTA